MAEIFINKKTGRMAEIPKGGCGIKGDALLADSKVAIKLINKDLLNHFLLKHCKYEDGEIVVLPEEEWPENQIEEDIE